MNFKLTYDNQTYSKEDIQSSSSQHSAFLICNEWLKLTPSFTIYTSGSTGKPKSIQLLRTQISSSVQQTQQALNLKENDSCLINLSCDYIAGKMMLFRSIEIGLNATIIPPSKNPLENIHTVFDFYSFVPLQLQTILEETPEKIELLNQAKCIIIGGAKMSQHLINLVTKHLTSPVYATFGMTETVSHIALKLINTPNPDLYFKTLDNTIIDIDQRSCLKIKGDITDNQWIQTNDKITLRQDGFQWIGRVDNVINSGGIKLQIESIESLIESTLNALSIDCRFFVTSLPDSKLGEKVVLFIEGNNLDNQTIESTLKKKLKSYHNPKKIYFIDSFKETLSGKVDKKATLDLI